MARVSLILPVAPGFQMGLEQVDRLRRSVEEAGHSVDVLVVIDPRTSGEPIGLGAWGRTVVAEWPGVAVATLRGLREARGDLLVVLDPEMGYAPEDLTRLIEPLENREAELVVATRWGAPSAGDSRTRLEAWFGALTRPFTGVTDPLSGLIAVSRETARAADGSFVPVGSRFSLELLMKTKGRRAEVAVRTEPVSRRARAHFWDDLRHFKRLADDRFGNASRLLQFCVVGASGMVVDLTFYALFQFIFSRTWLVRATVPLIGGPLELAVAGALAIAVALTWNFSLNRRLTFNDARHGSIPRQFVAYALSNALGIALSFTVRLILPQRFDFFDRHKLAAALVGIIAATGISFSMSRWVVFKRQKAPALQVETALAESTAVAEGS
jgi:dolichol-phosphate mannosyltransferase